MDKKFFYSEAEYYTIERYLLELGLNESRRNGYNNYDIIQELINRAEDYKDEGYFDEARSCLSDGEAILKNGYTKSCRIYNNCYNEAEIEAYFEESLDMDSFKHKDIFNWIDTTLSSIKENSGIYFTIKDIFDEDIEFEVFKKVLKEDYIDENIILYFIHESNTNSVFDLMSFEEVQFSEIKYKY